MNGHQIETNDHQAGVRRQAETPTGADHETPVHPLITLQSQIGNAQVARLLAQRDEAAEQDEDQSVSAKHDLLAQRDDASTDDEVQASHDEHVGIEGGPVGPQTAQRIQTARGGGSKLDGGTRASMESAFGTSFQDVRVHHDSESDLLNRRLTSHAFTTGSDIFLRGDSSPSDSHLMAHELTHVVQQRSMIGGGGMTVGAASDPHEQHADSVADSVLSSSLAPAAPAPAAQRDPDEEAVQSKHDLSVQRDESEEDVQTKHDLSIQRDGEEEEE
jgi:hypothetical protein